MSSVRPLALTATLTLATLTPRPARAFCNTWGFWGLTFHCKDDGHQAITHAIDFLNKSVYDDIEDELARQDDGEAAHRAEVHFDSCRFEESTQYIRDQYDAAIADLDPDAPDIFGATDEFGKLLHPVQDFYSHSNWIDLLGLDVTGGETYLDLIDTGTGPFRELSPLSSLGGDMIVGEIPSEGLGDTTVELGDESTIPVFTTTDGDEYRGLVTGWNPDGACPDVRDGVAVDGWSYPDPASGTLSPRTTRLVHGNPAPSRPCQPSAPRWVCLHQDDADRPLHSVAFNLALWQTQQEWCRLLHQAADSEYGLAASSILMTTWADPSLPPHPTTTSCAPSDGGPVEVQVDVTSVSGRFGDDASGTHLVFALYTDDFRQSDYSPMMARWTTPD